MASASLPLDKVITDACNKRNRLYLDLLLGRLPFEDFSAKMFVSLDDSNINMRKLEKQNKSKI